MRRAAECHDDDLDVVSRADFESEMVFERVFERDAFYAFMSDDPTTTLSQALGRFPWVPTSGESGSDEELQSDDDASE